jgi:hypothetical protein
MKYNKETRELTIDLSNIYEKDLDNIISIFSKIEGSSKYLVVAIEDGKNYVTYRMTLREMADIAKSIQGFIDMESDIMIKNRINT